MDRLFPEFAPEDPPPAVPVFARLTVSLAPSGAVEAAEVELRGKSGGELFYRLMRPVRGFEGPEDPLRELLACADRLTRDA